MKLKFLTLNILEGGEFFDEVAQFLHAQAADIFVLQEVYNGHDPSLPRNLRTMEIFEKEFAGYFSSFSPEVLIHRENPTEGKVEIGNAIFSKFPIVEESSEFFGIPYGEFDQAPAGSDWSNSPQSLQHAVIEVGVAKLNIINLHGVWGRDGFDNPRRLQMSEIILNHVRGNSNVIVAGDFNVRPHTKTIDNIEAHLTNVFKDELTTSFNLKRKDLEKFPGYAEAVVDMIFVSPEMKVLQKECPQVDVSDHLPLWCEVAVADK